MSKQALYKFHFDCGKIKSGGQTSVYILTGLFIAEIDKMKELVESGIDINFGIVHGQKPNIGPITKNDYTFVTDDQQILQTIKKLDLEIGYNPFDYLDNNY